VKAETSRADLLSPVILNAKNLDFLASHCSFFYDRTQYTGASYLISADRSNKITVRVINY